jgi:predicted nucleic-acid-binding protein
VIALDTNVLVRYFAQDDPVQSKRATAFIESEISARQPGFVSLVTLAELIWVLDRKYRLTIDAIKAAIDTLRSAPNIVVEQSELVDAAFTLPHAEFSDCLIHLIGQANHCTKTVTFDKRFARLAGVELLGV